MQKVPVSIKKLHERAKLPVYGSTYSSMADLCAVTEVTDQNPIGKVAIAPGATAMIRTGLAIRPAPGFGTKVYPRSGLAKNSSITLQNAVGVIDHDYPDELCLLVRNEGNSAFVVTDGMRIAQLEVHPVYQGAFGWVEELPAVQLHDGDVARVGGFGSTGTGAMGAAEAMPITGHPVPHEEVEQVADAQELQQQRSVLIGQAMQAFGEFLMECNITSSTGATHSACEEVGQVLRALGQNLVEGHAQAVTFDDAFASQAAAAAALKLQQI